MSYHGVEVVPSALLAAERKRDTVLRRVPSLDVRFSLLDLTSSAPGALARASRRTSSQIVLCHRVLDHLYVREIGALLRRVSEPAMGARYLVVNNQPTDSHAVANDDPSLDAARTASYGLANATHRIDLTQPPFDLSPLEHRQRLIPTRRPSDGASEVVMDLVRVFPLPVPRAVLDGLGVTDDEIDEPLMDSDEPLMPRGDDDEDAERFTERGHGRALAAQHEPRAQRPTATPTAATSRASTPAPRRAYVTLLARGGGSYVNPLFDSRPATPDYVRTAAPMICSVKRQRSPYPLIALAHNLSGSELRTLRALGVDEVVHVAERLAMLASSRPGMAAGGITTSA